MDKAIIGYYYYYYYYYYYCLPTETVIVNRVAIGNRSTSKYRFANEFFQEINWTLLFLIYKSRLMPFRLFRINPYSRRKSRCANFPSGQA